MKGLDVCEQDASSACMSDEAGVLIGAEFDELHDIPRDDAEDAELIGKLDVTTDDIRREEGQLFTGGAVCAEHVTAARKWSGALHAADSSLALAVGSFRKALPSGVMR